MLLDVRDLRVSFAKDGETTDVIRGVSFSLEKGERTALVGESGCGKSLTSLSLTRLPPTNRAIISGEIRFKGRPLTGPHPKIAYIFQDPIASLNPVMRIGRQLREACEAAGTDPGTIAELLESVDLRDPQGILRSYPCELSGGMCQRVMIAMGLARHPELLVADEPTTALDVTTQADVMDLVVRLVKERGMALLMATHNLGLVAGRCDTAHVLYAGQIVESGPVRDVIGNPLHPYAKGLVAAVPRIEDGRGNQLRDIPGTVPSPREIAALTAAEDGVSCAFRPRCPYATPACEKNISMSTNGNRSVRCARFLPHATHKESQT